jgi:3-oxoadipate enol-lactonase
VIVNYAIDESHRLDSQAAATVVLSNSLGATMAMWDAQVPALAQRFRVLRYDTRGHGISPVPPGPYAIDDLVDDVIALLDHLGLARVHFAGLSLGGMTGIRLAARSPERIARLALLCTSARLDTAPDYRERAALVRARGTGTIAEAVVGRWFTPGFHARHPDRISAARAMVASTAAEGYAGCCEALAVMDLGPDLARITAPTLALGGADDQATPPPHLQRIAHGIRGARLLIVPHAAHLASAEQPEIVTRALLSHLAGECVKEVPESVDEAALNAAEAVAGITGGASVSAPGQDPTGRDT